MKPEITVFVVAYSAVLIMAGSTVALHCQHCLFEGCDGAAAGQEEQIECNVHTVNRLYHHLAALANLEGLLSAPAPAQGFACFQVVISDGAKNGTVKSCAFAESDICSAWKPAIRVESCQVWNGSSQTTAYSMAGLPAGGVMGRLYWIVALPLIALKIGSIKL
uniref:(northern house mosquito) hypothetical protein n=1 Tax=Culex pipiens TaxID=7175 RepID=A0A8D8D0U2_CULPI